MKASDEQILSSFAGTLLTKKDLLTSVRIWRDNHSKWCTFFSPSRWLNVEGMPQGMLDLTHFTEKFSIQGAAESLTENQGRTLYVLDAMRQYRHSRSAQDNQSYSSCIFAAIRNSASYQNQVIAVAALPSQIQAQAESMRRQACDVRARVALMKSQASENQAQPLRKMKDRATVLGRLATVVNGLVEDMRAKVAQNRGLSSEQEVRLWRLQNVSIAWEIVRRTKGFFKAEPIEVTFESDGARPCRKEIYEQIDLRMMWPAMIIQWVTDNASTVMQDAFVTAYEEAKRHRQEKYFFLSLGASEGDLVDRVDAVIRWACGLWRDQGVSITSVGESTFDKVPSDDSLVSASSARSLSPSNGSVSTFRNAL